MFNNDGQFRKNNPDEPTLSSALLTIGIFGVLAKGLEYFCEDAAEFVEGVKEASEEARKENERKNGSVQR